MRNSNYYKYIRLMLLVTMCSFSASFFLVEQYIALVHIQLGLIIVFGIASFLTSPTNKSINKFPIIYFGLITMWFCLLISIAINNDWQPSGLNFLNNKIWLVVLPILFMIIPTLNKKEALFIMLSYLLGVLIFSSIAVLKFTMIKLGFDNSIQLSNAGIIDPEVIPFKMFHHTLSVLIGLGIVFAILLLQYFRELIHKYVKYSVAFIALIFVIYIMLISARIGFVIIFFLLIGYSAKIFIYSNLKFYTKLLTVVGLVLVVISLALLNPNTIQRIKVTMGEVERADVPEKNHGENISARLLAYKVSFNLIVKYPITGISFSKENLIYLDEYDRSFGIKPSMHPCSGIPLKPHTEFLRFMVILGIPIGSIFIISYFSLFFIKKNSLRFDYWLFLGVFSLYMMTDFPFHLKEVFYLFCFFLPFWSHLMQSFAKESTTDSV